MTENSDELLLINWHNGDENAFRSLYELYFISSIKKVYYKTGDFQLSEEIVQDAFMSFYKNKNNITRTPLIYLNTIIKNKIIDHYRKKIRLFALDDLIENKEELSKDSITENINLNHLNTKINQILQKMTNQVRTVFLLSREEYMSNKEIAEKLGISSKTVEQHMTKALKILKENLNSSNYIFLLFVIVSLN